MSMYSNWLQPPLQNLLQRVVRFFHPRSSCTMTHYIGGRSENNSKCVVHDNLGWQNRTTRYILSRHWLYEWFSQFQRCGTYSVLSQSPSIAKWATIITYSIALYKTQASTLRSRSTLCHQVTPSPRHKKQYLKTVAMQDTISWLKYHCITTSIIITTFTWLRPQSGWRIMLMTGEKQLRPDLPYTPCWISSL